MELFFVEIHYDKTFQISKPWAIPSFKGSG